VQQIAHLRSIFSFSSMSHFEQVLVSVASRTQRGQGDCKIYCQSWKRNEVDILL
jgi:hypothetical protein